MSDQLILNTTQALPSTLYDMQYTYSYSKIACVHWMFPLHMTTAYLVTAMGIFALICRVIPKIKWMHKYAGIGFVIVMLYLEGTSILIYNTGLPRSIIFFLTWMLVWMTIGWIAIKFHQARMHNRILENMSVVKAQASAVSADKYATQPDLLPPAMSNVELYAASAKDLVEKPRTWWQRFFSLKGLHGFAMTMAWYMMFGRSVASNPVAWQGCYVQPVLKPMPGDTELYWAPDINPNFGLQGIELTFTVAVVVPGIIAFIAVGLIWSAVAGWRSKKAAAQKELDGAEMVKPQKKEDGSVVIETEFYQSTAQLNAPQDAPNQEVTRGDSF